MALLNSGGLGAKLQTCIYSLWRKNVTAQIELHLEEQLSTRAEIWSIASLLLLDL